MEAILKDALTTTKVLISFYLPLFVFASHIESGLAWANFQG